jgi:hypothetical protein
METFGVPDMPADVFKVLTLLRPYDISIPKVRVGPLRDGGYVLARVDGTPGLISFGISNDVRFEKAIAEDGYRCFMYDHTIDDLPEHHTKFNFCKIGVSGTHDEGHDLLSIMSHLDRIDHSQNMLLKIDVEGAEWDVFSTIDIDDLEKFDQIVGEFHWFLQLGDEQFRKKVHESPVRITSKFTLFHVHANNCRPLGFVDGFAVADVLEFSFIRTELIQRSPSTSIFPESCDNANNHAIADHTLLFYPFLPAGSEYGNILSTIARVDEDKYNY